MNRDDLSERLHALTGMEVSALRAEWKRLYRNQPPARQIRQEVRPNEDPSSS